MANIKDVARLAGVSISTVSRVVNHTTGVAPEKYHAVQRAMKDLHYQPNSFAKALVSNKSNTIGLVVSSLSKPFFGLMMQQIEKITRQHKKQLIIASGHSSAETEKEAIESIINQRCDALIVHSEYLTDFQLMELLGNQSAAVIVNRKIPDIKERCLYIDNRKLAEKAVTHLIEQGHREIAAIIPETSASYSEQRLHGYQDVLSRQGIIFNKNNIIRTKDSLDGGFKAINTLLKKGFMPSALFINSTTMTAGCLKSLREKKILVPSDLSLITINDGVPADYFHPELTMVKYPIKEISESAAHLALSLFEKNQKTPSFMFETEILHGSSVSKK